MELETTINDFPVTTWIVENQRYIECHNVRYPSYHLKHLINFRDKFANIFDIDSNITVKDISMTFNMVVKFEELEELYNEIIEL